MKKLILVLLLLMAKSKSIAQITNIPDYRFEQALIDLGIDSDLTINGHILTSDALLVTQLNLSPTSLPNYPYPAINPYDGMIHDLSGIESFVNLEHLVVNSTMIDYLNLNNLTQLKYLDCVDNMLTSVNVSNNVLLEYINVTSEGDVIPINNIGEIDLSGNLAIHTVIASGVGKINLHNYNNLPNVMINVGCSYCFDFPSDVIVGNVCIDVDNVEQAQNNEPPYSGWTVYHAYRNINYTNDLDQCSLGTSKFKKENIGIYPNPVQSGILYLKSNGSEISSITILDLLGRKILDYPHVTDNINISGIQKGNYIVKIYGGKGVQTEKLIVE